MNHYPTSTRGGPTWFESARTVSKLIVLSKTIFRPAQRPPTPVANRIQAHLSCSGHDFSQFFSISNAIEPLKAGPSRYRAGKVIESRRLFLRDPPAVQPTALRTWQEAILGPPGCRAKSADSRSMGWVKAAFLLALLLLCTGLHFLSGKKRSIGAVQKSAEQQLHDEQLRRIMRGFQVRGKSVRSAVRTATGGVWRPIGRHWDTRA